MKIKRKTGPLKYPVSREEAKDQLRVDLDLTTDDAYIDTLIATATQSAEQYLHRRLITQTWYLYLPCWWYGNSSYYKYSSLTMPFGRLQSVTSIKYKDQDGTESTWDAENYIVDTDSDPGNIVLGYNKCFPTDTLYPSNPITIEFVCGYGLLGSDVEDNIRHAIKLGISDLYENRETQVITGGSASLLELPTFYNLLFPFKVFGAI